MQMKRSLWFFIIYSLYNLQTMKADPCLKWIQRASSPSPLEMKVGPQTYRASSPNRLRVEPSLKMIQGASIHSTEQVVLVRLRVEGESSSHRGDQILSCHLRLRSGRTMIEITTVRNDRDDDDRMNDLCSLTWLQRLST